MISLSRAAQVRVATLNLNKCSPGQGYYRRSLEACYLIVDAHRQTNKSFFIHVELQVEALLIFNLTQYI